MGRGIPVGVLVALVLAACSSDPAPQAGNGAPAPGVRTESAPSSPSATGSPTLPPPSPRPRAGDPSATASDEAPTAREPRRSFITIPALGLRDFPVVRYRGRPDDAPGTRMQDAGPMASPRGPRGGVGPGQVGNFIVTGHRTSSTAPLAELPFLETGDRVRVGSGRTVFVYEIRLTRETSFRSAASKARQVAAVPGRPGVRATRAMVTLSTCATPEDHAAGNFWSDELGNPGHRIDKIGVLVSTRPARS